MQSLLNNPYFLSVAGILGIVNLILLLILFWQFHQYRDRQNRLLSGQKEDNLEEIVLRNKKTLQIHDKNLRDLAKILREVVQDHKLVVQKMGMVRFNPFAETGGNMSFALALLDADDNGILISSLHGREGTRIYAKALEKGKAQFPLTEEEKEAIGKANQFFNLKKSRRREL